MKAIRRITEFALRLGRDRAGAAAVEMGLVAPMLLGVLVPVADLGMGAYAKMRVQDAAAAGAQAALTNGFSTSTITSAAQAATSLGSNVTMSATPAEVCYCTNASKLAPPPGDETPPAPPCTVGACADGSTPGTFVTVATTYTYTPWVAFSVPGLSIPSSYTLTGSAVARIQ
jgi:Flp pilus assembly protein TadG